MAGGYGLGGRCDTGPATAGNLCATGGVFHGGNGFFAEFFTDASQACQNPPHLRGLCDEAIFGIANGDF